MLIKIVSYFYEFLILFINFAHLSIRKEYNTKVDSCCGGLAAATLCQMKHYYKNNWKTT